MPSTASNRTRSAGQTPNENGRLPMLSPWTESVQRHSGSGVELRPAVRCSPTLHGLSVLVSRRMSHVVAFHSRSKPPTPSFRVEQVTRVRGVVDELAVSF